MTPSQIAFPELMPRIDSLLKTAVPEAWPGLHHLLDHFLRTPRPEALLPLAACQAVGGDAADATPVSAAIVAAEISLLVLDDVYDRDRPYALFRTVGPARACNFASALHTVSFKLLVNAPLPPAKCRRILEVVCNGYLEVASGQDLDLASLPYDLDSYWAVAERKTGGAYATALEAGALVATENEALLRSFRTFGYHLGLSAQIFNDLRGTWFPVGKSDVEQGKVTLPIVYGLSCDHPERGLLEAVVKDGQVANHQSTILEILDRIDARAFLVWAALQHRQKALSAIGSIPLGPGVNFLQDFITGAFGNIDELLKERAPHDLDGTERARDVIGRDGPGRARLDVGKPPIYDSRALSLRQELRGRIR